MEILSFSLSFVCMFVYEQGMSAQLDVLSAKQQHHAATVLASLPPATPSKPSAHAHGSHRAPHARPTSPLQPLDEHAGDGDDDGHAQQQHSNDGGSGDGTLMWPSLPSPLLQQMRTGTAFAHAASPDPTAGPAADAPTAQHDEDATPRVEFATDAGGGGGGKPLTRGSKSVALPRQHAKQAALGNLALSAHPGALALPDADDEAGAEAPPGAAAAAGHADKAPRVHPSDVSRVVDRAAKESKDQQRRTFLLGASQVSHALKIIVVLSSQASLRSLGQPRRGGLQRVSCSTAEVCAALLVVSNGPGRAGVPAGRSRRQCRRCCRRRLRPAQPCRVTVGQLARPAAPPEPAWGWRWRARPHERLRPDRCGRVRSPWTHALWANDASRWSAG